MHPSNTYPIPQANAVGRIVDDKAVIVLPDRGKVKVLNEVGARIWALTDGSRSIAEIVDAICAEYAVERAQAESDTLAFVADLEAKGVVTLASEPAQT